MFKSLGKKLKSIFIGGLKDMILKEIDGLDRYEEDLAALIRKNLDPEKSAKAIVDFVQMHLRGIVEKIF